MKVQKNRQADKKPTLDKLETETAAKKKTFALTPLTSLLGVVFIFIAAQILAVNIVAITGHLQGKNSEQIVLWLQDSLSVRAVILLLIVLVGVLLTKGLLYITKSSWQKIGFNKFEPKYIGQAVLGYGWYFLVFLGLTFLVSIAAPNIDLNQQQELGFDRGATGAALLLIGLSLVLLPAFYEEVLMRGILFTGVRSKLPFWATLIIVSIVFGAAHLEWGGENPLNWAAAIDTFALSAVLVYLRESSRSLWPAIILHGIKNLIAFSIVFVFKLPAL